MRNSLAEEWIAARIDRENPYAVAKPSHFWWLTSIKAIHDDIVPYCSYDGIIPFTKCSHFDRDQSVWMNLFSMQLTADSGNCGDKKLSVTDLGRKSISDGAKYAGFVWPHRVGDENLN